MAIVLLDVAIYAYYIMAALSSGRAAGFALKQSNKTKEYYWVGISLYCFLTMFVLMATLAALGGIEASSPKSIVQLIFNPIVIAFIAIAFGYFSVPTKNELVIKKCRDNLKRGRAVATGIGVFGRVIEDGKMLLRRRTEKDSLFGEDLSGRFELIGGGVEVCDFKEGYQSAAKNTLVREFDEEAGMILDAEDLDIILRIAWLGKDNAYDLAFSINIPRNMVHQTCRHKRLLSGGHLVWVPFNKLDQIEFVSKRMKELATQGIL